MEKSRSRMVIGYTPDDPASLRDAAAAYDKFAATEDNARDRQHQRDMAAQLRRQATEAEAARARQREYDRAEAERHSAWLKRKGLKPF